MKIGVFDSGIGGLMVLKEIINKYPNSNYIYYGDTLHLPYGEKTKEELLELTIKIIEFFLNKNVDLIVIACGTVSSNIYKELCSLYSVTIMNIINPTIDKIIQDNVNNVVVLATNKTIESRIFSKNLNDINVIEIPCPKLVPLIENNVGNKQKILEEYLHNIKYKQINNIVLGCTHYSLLEKDIENYLKYPVNFYNMGKILANKLKLYDSNFSLSLYFSKIDTNLINNINKIIDFNFTLEEKIL